MFLETFIGRGRGRGRGKALSLKPLQAISCNSRIQNCGTIKISPSTESLADYILNLHLSEQQKRISTENFKLNNENLKQNTEKTSRENCDTNRNSKAVRNNIFTQSIGLIKTDKRRIKDIALQKREADKQFEDVIDINNSSGEKCSGASINLKNSKTVTTKKNKREWDKTKYWDAENEMWLTSETSRSNLYTYSNRSSRRSSNSIDSREIESEDYGSSSPSYFGYR